MTSEAEALQRLRHAVERVEFDAETLVAEARADARTEVLATLKRLFAYEMLNDCLESVERANVSPPSASPVPEPEPPTPIPEPEPPTPIPDPGVPEPPPPQPVPPDPGPGPDPTPPIPEPEPSPPAPGPDPGPPTPGPGPTPPDPEPMPMTSETVTYVFGIARGWVPLDDPPPTLPGGGPVRTVDHRELRALVCHVDPAVFEDLGVGTEGLDRLAAVAMAHDAVLARTALSGPVVPLRLGTIVAGDEDVREVLERYHEVLRAELERFAGVAEWAVTAQFVDDGAMGANSPDSSRADDGRAYMEAQHEAFAARRATRDERTALIGEVHARLAAFARETTTADTPPESDVSRAYHGLHLLEHGRIDDFDREVRALREQYPTAVIEVSGPWPPYHFTTIRLADEDGR